MSAVGRAQSDDPIIRITTALERLADANEAIVKLASDDEQPVLERVPGLPVCPHCGEFNPSIGSDSGGEGKMDEFVLIAQCGNCQGRFFAVPEGWQVFESLESVKKFMKGGIDNGN